MRGGDAVLSKADASPLDALAARDLIPLVVAALAITMLEIQGLSGPRPLDAVWGVLTVVTALLTLRAVLSVARALGNVRRQARLRAHVLVHVDDALVLLGARPQIFPLSTISDVHGFDEERPHLLMVRRDGGAHVIELPYGANATLAATRVRRLLADPAPAATEFHAQAGEHTPSVNPRADFERVVRGDGVPGELAVPVSLRFLELGPYTAAAAGAVLLREAYWVAQLAEPPRLLVSIGLVGVLVPIVFLAFSALRVRDLGGATLVLTRAEVLTRTRRGMHRVPFRDVASTRVVRKRTWTLLTAMTVEARLVVERGEGPPMTFDGRLLGFPADLVAAAIEAQRDAFTPASHGSGGGGGISGVEATTA